MRLLTRLRMRSALKALRKLHVSVQGPVRTPRKQVLYVIAGGIVTAPELISLHKNGKLKAGNQENLLHDIEHLQSHESA